MHNRWYSAFKYVFFGPFLRVWNRPTITGLEHVPDRGPAMLVSNHQAVMDSFYLPLLCPRQMTFPAKSEYFTTPGVVGRLQKWFFTSVGQVPIDRSSKDAGEAIVRTAQRVFERGDLFGIYPEGTRSPDGRVYRGHTGMARIAFNTGEKVIPVVMIGSREANPIGSWIPRPRKVRILVGEPLDARAWAVERGLDPETHEAARAFTDHVMHLLAETGGYPYVDEYAAVVKESLARGDGYPEGTRPGHR